MVFDLLVRRDPADEQDVVEPVLQDRVRSPARPARSSSRSVSTTIGSTPVGANPARRVPRGCTRRRPRPGRRGRPATPAPRGRRRPAAQMPASYGAKKCGRRDVVVAAARARPAACANAAVIGDGIAKWKIVMSPCRAPASSHGRTSPAGRRRSSARRCRTRGPARRNRSRSARALSPTASPRWAAGIHWLTIIAGVPGPRPGAGRPGASGRARNAAGRYCADASSSSAI